MKIAVLTSGGDAPGMNTAIRSIVRTTLFKGHQIYGVKNGYEGLLSGDIFMMDRLSVSDIIHRGGTILRTSRSKEFQTKNGMKKAVTGLREYKIDLLIVIGGNGSLTGGTELSKHGISILGLPGTIDNDLKYTDFTIGFDTALNTALSSISKIRDTSESHRRTTIVEVMGRACGDLAIYSAVAGGGEIVLIPEDPMSGEKIIESLNRFEKIGKSSNLIIKAEGYNNFSLAELEELISKKTSLEVKTISLGYVQRGGSPTAFDRILASRLGNEAVSMGIAGKKNLAFGIKNGQIISVPIKKATESTKNKYKKDLNLINTLSN